MLAHVVWERRYQWARAYRGSLIVCRRLGLTVRLDPRLGLASRQARDFLACFCEGVHPGLLRELELLAHVDELEAERVAERLSPIRIVAADMLGPLDVTGSLWPPIRRHGSLDELDFRVRELDASVAR